MVVGGAISVLRFRNRTATDDVDFYVEDPTSDGILLQYGARAADAFGWRDQDGWFNSAVGVFIGADPAFRELYSRSLTQNDPLYQSPALRLFTAPWKWQLYMKMVRLTLQVSYGHYREADLSDAVTLLHHIACQNGGPIDRNIVYQVNPLSDEVLEDATFDLVQVMSIVTFFTSVPDV